MDGGPLLTVDIFYKARTDAAPRVTSAIHSKFDIII